MWMTVVAMWLHTLPGPSIVRGVVRAADSGEPIPGAALAIPDAHVTTWSDSAGRYTLALSAPGTYHVWVSRLGYHARAVDLVVDSNTPLVVDIALSPEPVHLAPVAIVDSGRSRRAGASGGAPFEAGTRRFEGDALHANPALGEADALGVLTTTAAVMSTPGSPTSLHVRGGAGDQNLVLLDGIPIYNAYHVGGTLAALDADAISSVTLHAGSASAQYGGALSSVIALRTSHARPERFTAYGGIGATGVRQTIAAPLPWAGAWILVSGRHSLGEVYSSATQGQAMSAATYSDLFAKATLGVGPGTLEVFGFGTGDGLGFDALVNQNPQAANADTGLAGSTESANAADLVARNVFRWSSRTQAAVWTVGDSGSVVAVVRAWHSASDATAGWAGTTGPLALANSLSGTGAGARLLWATGTTQFTTGVDLERLRNRYAVQRLAASGGSPIAAWSLASDLPELAMFVEGRWRLTERWNLRAGLRAPRTAARFLPLEPRIMLGFRASPRVSFAAGYSRMHQNTQSLRNDESLLDGLFGIALPVTARPGGPAVARSDELSASMQASLDHDEVVTVNTYVRHFADLLLVAPATAEPFATSGYARGAGQARGVGVSATHFGTQWSATAAYSLGTTMRQAGVQHYRPGYDVSQQFNAGIARHLGTGTTVRAALWAMVGRPATATYGDFQWAPAAMVNGAGALAGSPQQFVGLLGGARLPAYWRLDVGIRHQWRHPRFLPPLDGVAGVLSIHNLLDRRNVLGVGASASALGPYAITLPPRSLVFGLDWAY